jgi:hypothetical protein
MPYHDQPLCLCTAATSRMLTCSTEIQGDFSLSWDPINGNLEFSITWLTQLWSMCGCCNGKCVPRKSTCNESEGIQNWFHKSLYKLGTQSAHRQTMGFWHTWRRNKDIQSLLLPQSMFKIIQVVTGLYERTREQHADSQTTHSTHIVSCDKCKLNPCLK